MVKYDQIPEETKDPNLIKAKKRLKKKMPTRRKTEQYWNESQFERVKAAPPGNLASRGNLPWRLLAYLLTISPEVERLRTFVNNRLLDAKSLEHAERQLTRMLLTLEAGGYVKLEPSPPHADDQSDGSASTAESGQNHPNQPGGSGGLGALIQQARAESAPSKSRKL